MYGPLNRKGLACSECANGFGPSVDTNVLIKCRDAWYGVPLILLLELVPIIVLYLIILALVSNQHHFSSHALLYNVYTVYCHCF